MAITPQHDSGMLFFGCGERLGGEAVKAAVVADDKFSHAKCGDMLLNRLVKQRRQSTRCVAVSDQEAAPSCH